MAAVSRRIHGLDALRFVLASVVVLRHFAPVQIERKDGLWLLARVVTANLMNGPAAVIAFFVISGLCIHYPNRGASTVRTFPFYVRREIRIVVPAAVTLLTFRLMGQPIKSLHDSTLWSLICEEVYYLLYPLLLVLFRRFGVRRLIVLSYVVAYALVLLNPTRNGNYIDLGWRLTWLLGLPCWLLGCELAERIDDRDDPRKATSPRALWTMRAVVFVVSVLLSVLKFHTPLTNVWTLDLFALLCFAWLRAEIFYYGTRPAAWFERLGVASYSIYLTHTASRALWQALGGPDINALALPFVFACAWVFYRLVEKPSHALARSAEKRLSRGLGAQPEVSAAGE
jgi:peptidoglycan/LPS O-acetylase OafA/YrhL